MIRSGENNPQISEKEMSNCNKLDVYDWLKNVPKGETSDLVEIRFKNTRKMFFRNNNNLRLKRGDVVVVESDSGHDIGIVSITGSLAVKQFRLKINNPDSYSLKKIYRKAKQSDIEKWTASKNLEMTTLKNARKIAASLNLAMKISDVEYQGDNTKATFYYTAEDRVDFRELIKVYATEFGVKIEMKQIGMRQEAARLGGIGTCGRELCCSTWRTDLTTISIQAARYQELPLNVQKLSGQCGKLKCCLIYELDNYMESWNELPDELLELETSQGILYKFKIDVLKKIIWYSNEKNSPVNLISMTVDQVKEIIMLNKKGVKADISAKNLKNPTSMNFAMQD